MQIKYFAAVVGMFLSCAGNGAEFASLSAELEPLRAYLDKTWRGNLSQPGQPDAIDISRWERALNGTAIKIRHSVNAGEYGGETMLFYDKKLGTLKYYYFTTAGFYTHGTMTIDPKNQILTAEEDVENNQNGITKVRSVTQLKAKELRVTSEYLQNGKWVAGHAATYLEAPQASVVLK